MGRLLGVERNGSCGREVRVFCVNRRGAFGGRKGRRKSILRIGSRGRIFKWPV
jgi:hypothetical protein